MKRTKWLALVMALGCVAMSAPSAADDAARNLLTIRMKAYPQNAGRVAEVTLVARKEQTELVFIVSGVPSMVTMPPHLHTYIYPGTCASRGDRPVYVISSPSVLGDRVPMRSNTMARRVLIPLASLVAADHAIVLRTSPADGFIDIFCGDVRSAT